MTRLCLALKLLNLSGACVKSYTQAPTFCVPCACISCPLPRSSSCDCARVRCSAIRHVLIPRLKACVDTCCLLSCVPRAQGYGCKARRRRRRRRPGPCAVAHDPGLELWAVCVIPWSILNLIAWITPCGDRCGSDVYRCGNPDPFPTCAATCTPSLASEHATSSPLCDRTALLGLLT